ncbi:rhodanese-like domain-containing protein [Mycoplasma feriruminatoris]|uniref:rhodanese-like domain-containing protein n=1 Tax=Mycoplasma feriruminatoris TaxID=1179777 RepID=UPI00241C3786|nr:rhodanese-like domain-containing protein [Mycoplasma feriruminatoris]WFQ91303.1 rhodanese-like domain-containing protein [Mycoplasma feriruminatoris]WFQ96299.1 rhodanese-like domain-containing protein [Mycoplasma feriruminatoris]
MKNSIEISNEKFFELLDKGWQVIDVRDKYEYENFEKFLPSLNISYPEVLEDVKKRWPNLDAKLIFVCNHGNRSGLTARYLHKLGYFNVYVLDTGIAGL